MPNGDKYSVAEFATIVRNKYNAYQDIADDVLVNKYLEKYPVYQDRIDFGEKQPEIKVEEDLVPDPVQEQVVVEEVEEVEEVEPVLTWNELEGLRAESQKTERDPNSEAEQKYQKELKRSKAQTIKELNDVGIFFSTEETDRPSSSLEANALLKMDQTVRAQLPVGLQEVSEMPEDQAQQAISAATVDYTPEQKEMIETVGMRSLKDPSAAIVFDDRDVNEQLADYKSDVEQVMKNVDLTQEEKDKEILSLPKPTYSYLKVNPSTGNFEYESKPFILNKVKEKMSGLNLSSFDTKKGVQKAINDIANDLVKNDDIIKYQFEVVEKKYKKDFDKKTAELKKKYDMSTDDGRNSAIAEMEEYRNQIFKKEVFDTQYFKQTSADIQRAVATVGKDINKEWARQDSKILSAIDWTKSLGEGDIVKYIPGVSQALNVGAFAEGLYKAVGPNLKESFNQVGISIEQLPLEKIGTDLKAIENLPTEDGDIYLFPDGTPDYKRMGLDVVTQFDPYEIPKNRKESKAYNKEEYLAKLNKLKDERVESITVDLKDIETAREWREAFNETDWDNGETVANVLMTVGETSPNLALTYVAAASGSPLVAGIAVGYMFSQEYAGNYWNALETGLKEDLGREPTEEDFLKALEEGKYASQSEAAGFAALQSSLEYVGSLGVLKNTFKVLNAGAPKSAVSSIYKGEIKRALKQGKITLKNMSKGGFTEAVTEAAQETLGQISTGVQLDEGIFDYVNTDQIIEAAKGGGAVGFFLPGFSGMVRQTKRTLRNTVRNAVTKLNITGLGDNMKAADKFFKDAIDAVNTKYELGEISKEELQEELSVISNIRNTGLKIPKNFSTPAREKMLNLMLERDKLNIELEKADEAFKPEIKEQIKKLNQDIVATSATETITQKALKASKKAGLGDMFVGRTKESVDTKLNELVEKGDISEKDALEAKGSDGFIVPETGEIIINLPIAENTSAFNVASHELLHKVLYKTISKDPKVAETLSNSLKNYLNSVDITTIENEYLKERLELYKDKSKEMQAEEMLTIFSDALALGAIKVDENVLTKIGDSIRRIMQSLGFKSIKFKDGKDVLNFIRDYNKSIQKVRFTKAQVKLAKEGVDVTITKKPKAKKQTAAEKMLAKAEAVKKGDVVTKEDEVEDIKITRTTIKDGIKDTKGRTIKVVGKPGSYKLRRVDGKTVEVLGEFKTLDAAKSRVAELVGVEAPVKKPVAKKPKAKKAAKIEKPEALKPLDKKETNAARGRYLNDFIGQSKDWLIDNIDIKNTDEWKKVDQDKKKATKEFIKGKNQSKFSKSSFNKQELDQISEISKEWINEEKNNSTISRGLIGKLTEDVAELSKKELNDRLKLIEKVAGSVSNIKFSKSKDVGPQINKLYNEMTSMWNDGGSDFTFQEIYKNKLLDELIGRRIDSFVLKGKPPGWTNESRADLINQTYLEFLPHIRNFNKAFHNYEKGAVENDNLFAWINSFMNEKVGNSFKKIGLKPEFDVDVTEAKAVTYEETEAQTEEREERDFSIRKKLGLNDDFKTKVFDKVKGVMRGRIPAVNSPEFKSKLEKEFERELFNTIREDVFGFQWQKRGAREVMPFNETKYDKFIRDNFLAMYEKLPLSTLSKMRSLKSGESLVKEVIDPKTGKQRRMTIQEAAMSGAKDVKAGNPIFEKFTPQELTDGEIFTEYFINPKIGRKSMRMEGLAKILAKEIAFDAVMEVVSDPAVFERMKDIYEIQDIDFIGNEIEVIGKQIDRNPNLKFSKSSSNMVSKPMNSKFSEEGSISASLAIGYFINEKYKKIPFNRTETFNEFLSNFERSFNKENYITKDGKKFDLKKKHKPLIYEYFVGKQFESILDEKGNKKFSVYQMDFKGFDNRGEGDLKIIENSTGKIADVEVKLDKKARFGTPGVSFKDGKFNLKTTADSVPIEVWNKINKILVDKGGATNLKKLFKKFGDFENTLDDKGKKAIRLNAKQHQELKDMFGTDLLNISKDKTGTVKLSNLDMILSYYKNKGTDYIYIGNQGLYSINDVFKIKAPSLEGRQKIRLMVQPQNLVPKGDKTDTYRIRVSNEISSMNPGLDYLNEKSNIYLLKNPEIKKQVKKSTIENKVMLSKSKVVKPSASMTNQDVLSLAATIDAALENARNSNLPVKKIRVFDFDDTLAQTKSNVLYTMPDGKKGKLTAEEFAKKGDDMAAKGAKWDFSEFNKVVNGKKGPLFKVAEAIQKARGTEDVFILTARAAEAAPAIKEFLKSVGLDIPIENITGLGDSSPFAKSQWVVEKAAEGYNDFYFADDAYKNVRAVQDALSVIDVKSKVQQAHVKFSKSVDLSETLNDMIEAKKGIPSEQTFDQLAIGIGKRKGKRKLFLPYSAEDFLGLIYPLISKGKLGDAQLEFFNQALFKPFARAMNNVSKDRVQMTKDFKALKKQLKNVPKNLRKEVMPGLTYENAVRIYIWDKQGIEVEGVSDKTIENVWEVMQENPELQAFADQLININKGDGYQYPGGTWLNGTITTDLYAGLNGVKRAKYLEEWTRNKNLMFTKENMLKLEAAYGPRYVESLKDILRRMETGVNRPEKSNRIEDMVMNWVNGSVGVTMFLNTRSAILQTISTINFINWKDNNPLAAGKAFLNFPQFGKDFVYLIKSDFMKDRRSGLKINVSESEVADAARKGGYKGVINLLLQAGFSFTKAGDAFAIAFGGATFYRNRVKKYEKEGMSTKEAEAAAFEDFREITEQSQQSARPDKISAQQSNRYGRVILAFANTPMQYNRIIKRAVQDIANGRGDLKSNISKIAYYGLVQNLIFNTLQQALFALAFDDEENEDKAAKTKQEKMVKVTNGMADSILRGMGYGGAAISVIKNVLLKIQKESEKEGLTNYGDIGVDILGIAPPIQAKIRRFQQAGKTIDYNKKEIEEMGYKFSLDNPSYQAGAAVISGATNIPLDRLMLKMQNIQGAMNSEYDMWQRLALGAGWNKWNLGIGQKEKEDGIVTYEEVKYEKVKYD